MRSSPLPAKLLGEKVRAQRLSLNMTQLELAHMIGWSGDDAGAAISKIESGKVAPSLQTMHFLAKALGIAPSELLK